MRIPLPKDQWADILDADDVTGGQRRRLFKAFNAARSAEMDGLDVSMLMMAHALVGWSFPQPLPVPARMLPDGIRDAGVDPYTDDDPNPLDEIPAKAQDAILKAATDLIQAITPDGDEPNPDPASPTLPSGSV